MSHNTRWDTVAILVSSDASAEGPSQFENRFKIAAGLEPGSNRHRPVRVRKVYTRVLYEGVSR